MFRVLFLGTQMIKENTDDVDLADLNGLKKSHRVARRRHIGSGSFFSVVLRVGSVFLCVTRCFSV